MHGTIFGPEQMMASRPHVARRCSERERMSGLKIEGVDKHFGSHSALSNITLAVPEGSFVCLLGPSGCGKTTLLRIIAGLEQPSRGHILLDGADITAVPAHRRDFGMVFQSLALFPHLTVGENVAYPLRLRGISKADQEREVKRLLDLVRLPGIAERGISQISGGQRQRVAVARALALKPRLFLLDEPMSALDAKLREALQVELKILQERLGITTILVTHNQREALTMADLVVVMSEGHVQQVAPPMEVYRRPSNAFVADFVGTTNLISGVVRQPGRVEAAGAVLALPSALMSGDVIISVRPEDLRLACGPSQNVLSGKLVFIRHLGATTELSVDIGATVLIVQVPTRDSEAMSSGAPVFVAIDPASCVVLH